MSTDPRSLAFQGAAGAYSDMAARAAFPGVPTRPCGSFATAFAAVRDGTASHAVIPVDNTLAGRVADVHFLIPEGGLSVVGETFLPIRHCLLGVKGAQLSDVREAWSHPHALPQCRNFLQQHGIKPVVHADTAGAAADIAAVGEKKRAAIAGEGAAEIYGLDVLARDIQDSDNNVTRFLILAREPAPPPADFDGPVLCSIVFTVKNMPAALYNALGVFATKGINMVKLESYMDSTFHATRFYCEVEGHPARDAMRAALAELADCTAECRVLGAYPAHPFRNTQANPN
jgi:prephenate dehydratase